MMELKVIHNYQRKRACQDADVKPVVRDPMDDDRVLVESGAEMTLVPHEPSEFEKPKHHLTHIPFQPWCTLCVKGKAQAEPHKRIERVIEGSELPVIQCDYLMLKDVAGTGGLKVLSMYENIRKRHVHSRGNKRPNRHVRKNVGSENAEFPWIFRHHSAV